MYVCRIKHPLRRRTESNCGSPPGRKLWRGSFRLTDVFRYNHGQIHTIHVHLVFLAEQSSCKGLSCSRWAIEQGTVSRLQDAFQPPILHDGVLVCNPCIDFFKGFVCVVIQYHVLPFQWSCNELGRKTDCIVWFIFPIQQDMAQKLFGGTELAAQERFAFAGSFQPQDILRIEPVVPLEHVNDSLFFSMSSPAIMNEAVSPVGRKPP